MSAASSGGNSPQQKVPTGPGYQVHLAEAVRRAPGVVTRAVGLIDDPHQADEIVRGGRADMVALGRAFLADPRWVWRAGAALGHEVWRAPQYARAGEIAKKAVKAAPPDPGVRNWQRWLLAHAFRVSGRGAAPPAGRSR